MIARSARTTILFLLLVLTAACSCLAQGGPPLIADDPGTPGNRHWEINLGITAQRLQQETDFEVPLLDVNYGAGDRVQLKLEIPYAAQASDGRTRSGLGNTKIGMKWRWADEDKQGFAFSTYPQLTFNNPTSSVRRGLVENGWQMFLPMELSKTVGRFEIDGELGYNVQQRRANEIWLGLIGGFKPSERIELLAELHSIRSHHFAENESVFALGGRFKLTKLNTLLFAAGRALPGSTSGQPSFVMYSGIQWAF